MKKYKMSLLLLLLFSLLTFLPSSAQELTVKKMESLPMDTYASVHKRTDLNGNPCAAVRVSLTVSGATFSGTNHLGDIDRQGADYILFMPSGSKKMYIQHPHYHELEVVFGDYGIDRLESLATYRVTINVPQTANAPQSKQTLTIKVTPTDAIVQIDGEVVDGNSILLTVGTHKYNVVARGYYSQEGAVEIKENSPAKLVVELDRKTAASQGGTVSVASQAQPQTQPVQPLVEVEPLQPVQQPSAASTTVGGAQTFTVKGVSFTMLPVEGGTFTMGATAEMTDPSDDEKPTHQVTLSSYYMGETEVTQALWTIVMGNNPSDFKGDDLPVEMVSWNDCQTFLTRLNALTGRTFHLPTEAEWEYAARGGSMSRGTQYSGGSNLDEVAWYKGNSGSKTHPVKTKKANELGLYDMTGNVWEWCQDWKGSYSSSAQTNPTGPASGSYLVYRGGSWFSDARLCSSSHRGNRTPGFSYNYLGFRLALSE